VQEDDLILRVSEKIGLTALYLHVKALMSEAFRAFILFILFMLMGVAFYHLRVARRITYGSIELVFAVIAMWIAINRMAGGNFSTQYILALLTGLYIMVRGLQNLDDGLRSLADLERKNSVADGTGVICYGIWRAAFYDTYTISSLPERVARIKMFWDMIIDKLEPVGQRQKGVSAQQTAEPEDEQQAAQP
jgi:hypothetical protein